MDLIDYLALSDEKQWQVLWDFGKHVDTFKSIDCSFVLYALYKFYVEVELNLETDRIISKSVFVYGHKLEKYTLDLDIKPKPWD